MGGFTIRLDHGEFSVGEGCRVLNQRHSPESSLRWSAADPFILGAGEMLQCVKASAATASRGLRLHRAERTESGATRRVTGIDGLCKNVYAKDGGAEYGAFNVKGGVPEAASAGMGRGRGCKGRSEESG